MIALIEMNLLPSGKKGATRTKGRRKRSGGAPKLGNLRESLKSDPLVLGLIVLVVLAVGHSGYSWASVGREKNRLEEELDVEIQDSIRYAENIAAADSLKARQDTLLQKVNLIRTIDSDRFTWAHLLDEVSRALPQFTWLTSLQQTGGTSSAIQFQLKGMVGATRALTQFMNNLESSPFVQQVRLHSQEQIQQGRRQVYNFVLSATYQTPDSSVIETEPIIVTGG